MSWIITKNALKIRALNRKQYKGEDKDVEQRRGTEREKGQNDMHIKQKTAGKCEAEGWE